MNPLVSISCLAYNQEKYVRETLDGFIMQKTSFPLEVIIHDDCSNDRTAMIIREYESRRPEMFRAIYQTENQMSKSGGGVIVQNTFAQARGKYIAMCEGDDYWTDPLKLQKQVDFLEANPDYVLCCHNSTVQYEDGKTSHPAKTRVWDTLTTKELILNYNDFTRDFLVCPAHTSSLMFKNHLLPQLPGWLSQGIAVDLPLIILLSEELVLPLMLETEAGPEYWLGRHNFFVITRYNRSPLYAMAVHQLSQEILTGHRGR